MDGNPTAVVNLWKRLVLMQSVVVDLDLCLSSRTLSHAIKNAAGKAFILATMLVIGVKDVMV